LKAGGGKIKGGSYEREVAKTLSLWITGGARDDCFWRSAMSGGRATIQIKKGKTNKTQTGDITAIDPIGAWLTDRFMIETKSYKDLELPQGILKNSGFLHSFWIDLVQKSNNIAKCPMLIGRQNYMPELLVLSVKGEVYLRLDPQKAIAILPLWHNARVYLFEYLTSTTCMAIKNYDIPNSPYTTSRLSRSE
jgi:hypothetical protein